MTEERLDIQSLHENFHYNPNREKKVNNKLNNLHRTVKKCKEHSQPVQGTNKQRTSCEKLQADLINRKLEPPIIKVYPKYQIPASHRLTKKKIRY